MLIKIVKWFRGYLNVRIKGYSPERFINLCSNKNILLWNIKKVDDEYEFNISVKAFKKIKEIVKKTKTRPYISKKVGLPFLIYKYKKRNVFGFGVVMCCFIIYALSLFIWDISISGGYTYTPEMLLKYLKTNEIYCGVLKGTVDCSTIEESMRKEYSDIGWVSAEIKGTRLIIKIVETKTPQKAVVRTEPCHIIAKKDGLILSVITRNGTPLVSAGSVVKKGDILVSGIIEIIGDNDVLLTKQATVADADIIFKGYYEYKDRFKLNYIEKRYTGENKDAIAISILNKKIKLYKPFKKYEKYDIIVSENNFVIGNNFYLPFKYLLTNYKEYNEFAKKYSKDEAIQIANRNLKLYLDELNKRGVLVITQNIDIQIDDNICKTFGKIIVQESAIEYKPIDDSEWRIIETDEPISDN